MARKYNRIKIKASNGLVLRNGPNLFGDIIGTVFNDAEYTVTNSVPDGHFVWGFLQEETGWILLENLKSGVSNVVKIAPQKKHQKRTPKRKTRQEQEDHVANEVEVASTETVDE